jgi:cyclopropane fatty-acyl-phospholipid synthase-like methyltransferase
MIEGALPKQYWDSVNEQVSLPVEYRPGDVAEIHRVLCRLPFTAGSSFLEIGCAPGGWMAYFARQFGLSVSGVEYASLAHRKTEENLRLLGIPAKVYHADFFEFESDPYDVVFSSGFVEHFVDRQSVVRRIAALCRPECGIVITTIPSMRGVNRWISKVFRPAVAAGHFPISTKELVALHESCGLRTHYVGCTGSLQLLLPVAKNRFARQHPRIAFLLNLPFRLWNKSVRAVTGRLGRYPRIGWISTGVLYIGTK